MEDPVYLTAREVRSRFRISEPTLYRWERSEKYGFPKPIFFGKRKYYPLLDIQSWEKTRAYASRSIAN